MNVATHSIPTENPLDTACQDATTFRIVPYLVAAHSPLRIPMGWEAVSCGFPSPAADYTVEPLSLDELMVAHPSATFMLRAKGDSMCDVYINDGDVLLVDKLTTARSGDIVIAELDGKFTVKRLKMAGGQVYLVPENPKYEPIHIQEGQELVIWGVVTWTLHRRRG